ncbi:VOC family protein [Ancylomarina euxinus]|uniref:VOC family protein n=1 Tax=Ancylomarina euxinus TaxID=2283627 RepID=A0A425Y001_9BACT|nr:VOC family protein [Ancylomarina euxinus]MCZ4695362.1 VOC family protein [Ancylomarina euxinus]MUP15558.1 VOC family protein [Ancylomarina euxinus]RRG21039.1 VOC family protein [Ancylomarina euxinus]
MKRVTGIGGIFFKCQDTKSMKDWYGKHLGFNIDDYGTSFEWRQADDGNKQAFSVWSPFDKNTKYFEPSHKDFMMNYRVENLEWLLEELKKEGVEILDEIESLEYGKFAHILDPEGNKIQLWEAFDEEYDKMVEARTK